MSLTIADAIRSAHADTAPARQAIRRPSRGARVRLSERRPELYATRAERRAIAAARYAHRIAERAELLS